MISKVSVLRSSEWLLFEAKNTLYKDADLVIKCAKRQVLTTSRLLFGLLLTHELQEELFENENSFLVLEDFNSSEIQDLIHNVYFSHGTISETIVKKYPFINWNQFKGPPENFIIRKKDQVECPICGKVLSDKKNLKKHADVVHMNIRNHACDVCGKKFIVKNDLLDHKRTVHDKIKAFICDSCGQSLSTRHGLRMHKLIHKEGSKSIACSKCDKTFRHSSTYRKHIARVHEFNPSQRLKCEVCDKLFNHSEGLKRHVKKFHSLEKPEHRCNLCPLAFVFNYDLNKHKKRAHQK